MGIRQRRAHGHGRMLPQRIERLEGLPGWAWNVVDARWETSFAALAAYPTPTGTPTRRAPQNLRLNQWVIGLRRPGQRQRLRRTNVNAWKITQLAGLTDKPVSGRVTSEELAAYAAAQWSRQPADRLRDRAGVELGQWVHDLRRPSRRANSPTPGAGVWRRCRVGPGSIGPDPRGRPRSMRWPPTPRSTGTPTRQAASRPTMVGPGVVGDRAASGTQQGKLSAERCRRLRRCRAGRGTSPKPDGEKTSPLAAFAATHRSCDPRPTTCHRPVPALPTGYGRRRAARAGSLSTERLKRLQSLPGWSPEARRSDAAWDENYDQPSPTPTNTATAAPGQHYRTASGMALGHWHPTNAAYRTGEDGSGLPRPHRLPGSLPGWAWNTLMLSDRGFANCRRTALNTSGHPGSKLVTESGHGLGCTNRDQRKKRRAGQSARSGAPLRNAGRLELEIAAPKSVVSGRK